MTDATRKKIIKWFWILVTLPVLLLVFMILLVWAFADIPSFKDLENPDNKLATQVLAEDGEILTTFHIENRTYVSYDEISPNLVHAAVATEDVRFYKHSGIDFKGLGRVLVKTIMLRNSSQGGGSTITQQLAKNMYFTQEKKFTRKVAEVFVAHDLEELCDKKTLFELYVNSIYFGSGYYNVYDAAHGYYDKDPIDMDDYECTMMAGIPNAPSVYAPTVNPKLAEERRQQVLTCMVENGYITEGEIS